MDLFRYSRDAWGQQTLEGINWELFWVFFGAAIAIIIAHAVYKLFSTRKKSGTQ